MKKVFVLLPDGVGLRNFAFGNFSKEAKQQQLDLFYWNNTDFPLIDLGLKEVDLDIGKSKSISDLYRRAKVIIELKQFYKKYNDKAYLSYIAPNNFNTIKNSLKSIFVTLLVSFFNSKKGVNRIKNKIFQIEKKSRYYIKSKEILQKEQPAMVFLTNHRPLNAISPILAAQDLNIPTATFIFSWDNLPKATLLVETDYYFVWSKHMKEELLNYYPEILEDQIKVTGTPQFETHYSSILLEKKAFCEKHNLDPNKDYICFSGDDITTSPYDEFYLEDLAYAVDELNKEGKNLGIIYRKCPVDFSERANHIIKKFHNIIFPIDPNWKKLGDSWNSVMPLKDDMFLLSNTLKHSKLVFNVGSSIVFDAFANQVPCAYINYNNSNVDVNKWNIVDIYKFIHFKSMANKKSVFWINGKEDFKSIIIQVLSNNYTLSKTELWYNKIVQYPQVDSSKRIVNSIVKLAN